MPSLKRNATLVYELAVVRKLLRFVRLSSCKCSYPS